MKKYSTDEIHKQIEESFDRPDKLVLPISCDKISSIHKNYIKKRGFNPTQIENDYKVQGTGPVGNYKLRLVIPIFHEMVPISYQTRDVTGNAKEKYKACAKKKEVLHYKNSLYAIDKANRNSVIVVEGIIDAWRLGENTVATYGIDFTQAQLLMLAKRFNKVFICFDRERQALLQARKLANQLTGLGINTEIHLPKTNDPGSMNKKEAIQFKNKFFS